MLESIRTQTSILRVRRHFHFHTQVLDQKVTLGIMGDELVFITGASGFIGSHVTDQILKSGYRARLSVRKEE